MFSTFAIVITLLLLMFFAYRGYSVLILAPIMATLAVLLSGDFLNTIPAYTDVFMGALSGFLLKFFPIFLLGALFGRLMADSGAATAIANTVVEKLGASKAILAVILVCAILTYGGVSLFVVAFAIYPIAKDLFRAADIHCPRVIYLYNDCTARHASHPKRYSNSLLQHQRICRAYFGYHWRYDHVYWWLVVASVTCQQSKCSGGRLWSA